MNGASGSHRTSTRRTRAVATAAAALVVAVVVAGAGACSGTPSAGDTTGTTAAAPPARSVVIAHLVDQVMVPGYEKVEASSRALVEAVTALCAAPTPEALATARQAWRDTNTAWNLTEAFRFGPAMGKATTVDYPIDATKVQKLLAAVKPPTPFTTESLAALGSDVRGLEAVELQLFGGEGLAGPDARRCSYTQTAAQIVARAATDIRTAWTDPSGGARAYAAQVKAPGPDRAMTEQMAIAEIVNGSIAALGSVSDKRLGRASGEVTGTPLPAETDAGPAHTARTDAIDILRSVEDVLLGAPGTGVAGSPIGLQALIAGQSRTTGPNLHAALDDATEAVAAIPDPLASVPPSDVGAVKAADLRVRAARVIFRTEVASQLGVTLTFSDSDGDS